MLSNIPGSPTNVCKSLEVAKLCATRRQVYDKVHSMRERESDKGKHNTVTTTKFGVKQGRLSKWTEEQQNGFVASGILETKSDIRKYQKTVTN